MGDATEDVEAYLDARYGRGSRGDRKRARVRVVLTTVLVATIVLAAVLATVLFVWQAAGEPVRGQEAGLRIVDDTRVEVTLQMWLEEDVRGECRIVVLDEYYAEIGARSVTVGPFPEARTVEFTADVLTSRRAHGARIDECGEAPGDDS